MLFYKYLVPDRVSSLQSRKFRFTQPGAFNDPFELRPWIWDVMTDAQIQEVWKQHCEKEAESWIRAQHIEHFGEVDLDSLSGDMDLTFSSDLQGLREERKAIACQSVDEFYADLNGNFGVFSLSERKDSLLMWAHYAKDHEGFVIGFSGEHEFFNRKSIAESVRIRQAMKVKYQEDRPASVLFKSTPDLFFLAKSVHWKYEDEWRVLLPLSEATERHESESTPYPIHLFDIPTGAFVEVICGERMRDSEKAKIRDILKNDPALSHVKLYQASLHESRYELSFTPIE
jgi:hypothetical protein